MARSEYAELGPLPTSGCSTFDEDTKTEGPYVTVLPHATTPVTHNGNNSKLCLFHLGSFNSLL